MLGRRRDARYAADVIAAWAQRYLPEAPAGDPAGGHGEVVVEETGEGTFQQAISIGAHRLLADEPVDVGGADTGPSPYDLVLAGLGACTSMTVRMYAERKGLPLDGVRVVLRHEKIHATDCRTCETGTGKIDRIERTITLAGDLDDDQRSRMMEIADRCPVHRTLTSEVDIQSGWRPENARYGLRGIRPRSPWRAPRASTASAKSWAMMVTLKVVASGTCCPRMCANTPINGWKSRPPMPMINMLVSPIATPESCCGASSLTIEKDST